jgi:hypothetical protein
MTATATGVLSSNVVNRTWSTAQRAIALFFVLAVLAVGAFAVGRASAPSGHSSPVIAPVSVPASATSGGAIASRCALGHPC